MRSIFNQKLPQGTTRLNSALIWDLSQPDPEIKYRPVPHGDGADGKGQRPVWRVRFSLTFDPAVCFGLDISGEVALGRGDNEPDFVSLNPYSGEELGVSRRHAVLRPSDTKLFIMDLGSTNGTWCNDHSIGVNTPYGLSDGDVVRLGRLEFIVRIVQRPLGHTALLHVRADMADVLVPIARAITSQLDLAEVMRQTVELAESFTGADETALWLAEEQTGQVFLEAEWRIESGQVTYPCTPAQHTPVLEVMKSEQPLQQDREPNGQPARTHTGHFAESALYMPISLGGVTFGVLSAVHREGGGKFGTRAHKMLTSIADMAAIAVQNARTHQSTEFTAARRAQVLTALNDALSSELKTRLNTIIGYADLLAHYAFLDEESADFASRILGAGNETAALLRHLAELTVAADAPLLYHAPCDLLEVLGRVSADVRSAAAARSIQLDFASQGAAYRIHGDPARLYRSILMLLNNVIESTPAGGRLVLSLSYGEREVVIRIRDVSSGSLEHLYEASLAAPTDPGGSIAAAELGLALVWATIEAHRGTIMAESADGKRVEFVITLPATLRIA